MPQQIADLLGFGLHDRRTQLEILPDLAGRNLRGLRGTKEKVHHTRPGATSGVVGGKGVKASLVRVE